MERGPSDQQESKASWVLFLAAFTALLGGLSMGTVLSWTSPAISSMQNERVVTSEISLIMSGSSPIQSDPTFFLGKDSTELISWIISIINIGGLIGSFIAGNICDWMGHRWFLFFSGLLSAGGWLFISLAINTNMVLVGRFITGFAIGCLSSSVNVYISEISTMKHRGWLGCCFSVFIVFGILGDSVAGVFVNWRMLSELCVIPPMLLSMLILFFPESPHWLVKKDREHDALKSLKRLRANEDCTTELNLIVEQIRNARQATGDEDSLDDTIIKSGVDSEGSLRSGGGGSNRIIVDSIVDMNRTNDNLSEDSAVKSEEDALKPEDSKSSFLKDLKLPHVWKPLLFGLIIMAIQQLSGSNSLFGQLQDILDSSKIKQISQQQAAIIVNVFFTVFACLSAYTVNLFGRRTLLAFSSFGYLTAHLMIGSYYLARDNGHVELAQKINFLPLIALIVFALVHAVGYGSVAWFLIPELAISYRNQISSLCVATNWIFSFIMTKNFPVLVEKTSYSATFMLLAAIGLLSAITVLLLIPETKGKTSRQIKAQFYKRTC